ncbi:MAG: hypothetical protein ACKVP4_09675, partial [Hyphomicrobium sp.]
MTFRKPECRLFSAKYRVVIPSLFSRVPNRDEPVKRQCRNTGFSAQCACNFRSTCASRFQPLSPGMDILVRSYKVKDLPKICFEGFYAEGKGEAMRKR